MLFDPEMETAAIEPDQMKATRAPETKPTWPAAEALVDNAAARLQESDAYRTDLPRVNMRSRPESGSSVLAVVPKAASVKLVGCKVWCEVLYKGRRGYVFNDFAFGKARAPVKTKSAKVAAKETNTVSASSAAERPLPAARQGDLGPRAMTSTLCIE